MKFLFFLNNLSKSQPMYQSKIYPPAEEKINILTHGFGCLLSIVATYFLLVKGFRFKDGIHTLSFGIYGFSLIILYAASTLFHSAKKPYYRNRLNIFDHAAIYILIAGSYTPFTLITLEGETGMMLFSTVWAFALVGVILKLFFTGRFDKISTAMYVLMGWLILFAINPLMENLSKEGLIWLFAGGISYTVGAIFYSFERLHFNHAIFHFFVLGGSFCHFVSIYYYVLPSTR